MQHLPQRPRGRQVEPKVVDRRIFLLRIETTRPDADRGLRDVLKGLLRRHQFRCTSAEEL